MQWLNKRKKLIELFLREVLTKWSQTKLRAGTAPIKWDWKHSCWKSGIETGVFVQWSKSIFGRNYASLCISEMKKVGKSNKLSWIPSVLVKMLVKTWWRWYQNDNCTISPTLLGNNILMVRNETVSEVRQLRLQVGITKKYQSLVRKKSTK